jgi:subtilase family serine protease
MKRRRTRLIRNTGVLAFAVTALGVAAAATSATGSVATASSVHGPTTAFAQGMRWYFPIGQVPISDAQCETDLSVDCYLPTQVEAAYNLPALYNRGITGKGTTIVVVDAYGSPTISDDLAQFDSYLGLGSPPFQIVKYGNIPTFDQTNGDMVSWASETTLDVEYAHAGAPGAKIVLVEAPTDQPSGYLGAVKYAITHRLGDVISMSYAFPEQDLGSSLHQYDSVFAAAEKAHITIVSASGDQGVSGYDNNGNYFGHPVVEYPASDPLVTAVGGTRLNLNSEGQRAGLDTAWNDTYNSSVDTEYWDSSYPVPIASGGGKSSYFGRPSYQNGVKSVTGSARGVPDISMSAACSVSVNVYQSNYGVQGWWTPTCGTSESTPMFAAVVALADQMAGHPLGLINPALYELAAEHAPGIVPVASGNNTVSFNNTTVRGYTVRNGYNLVTGLGTVNGQYLVPELAKLG